MRKRMDGGLSLTTLTKMLENTKSPKSYTELRMCSTPRFKQRFNVYLKFCKEKELVVPQDDVNGNNSPIVVYSLADKGWQFLEMIE